MWQLMTYSDGYASSGCISISFTYGGSEPAYGAAKTDCQCYFKSGTVKGFLSAPKVGVVFLNSSSGTVGLISQSATAVSSTVSSISCCNTCAKPDQQPKFASRSNVALSGGGRPISV